MSADYEIRRELRAGDLGAIVEHHGRAYAAEHGVDPRFEAHVAASVAHVGDRGFPREREAIWIVELGGAYAGGLGVTDEGEGVAMLRWVLLEPSLRGRGLGRRLITAAIDHAERAGFERICLETFSELRAAAHIYRSHGFEVVSADTAPRWGREAITYQRYELELPRSGTSRGAIRALAGSA